jgi:hypothetical protein
MGLFLDSFAGAQVQNGFDLGSFLGDLGSNWLRFFGNEFFRSCSLRQVRRLRYSDEPYRVPFVQMCLRASVRDICLGQGREA